MDSNSSEAVPLTNSSNDFEESVAVPKSSKAVKCRKNDQCVQQALRSLNRLSTPEEKFTVICAKYADIFDENRKLQVNIRFHSLYSSKMYEFHIDLNFGSTTLLATKEEKSLSF